MSEVILLTVDEVGTLLRVSRRSVFEMTRTRNRAKQKHPLPIVRLNQNCLRFVKQDVLDWVSKLSQETK
jgi:hypothetical protein